MSTEAKEATPTGQVDLEGAEMVEETVAVAEEDIPVVQAVPAQVDPMVRAVAVVHIMMERIRTTKAVFKRVTARL